MKALVVGGAGYIGFEVCKVLRSIEYSTYLLDVKREVIPIATGAGIKVLVDDVISAVDVRQNYDVIVNLVGGLDDANLYGVNMAGVKQACAPLLLRQMSPKARLIHVSTQFVYSGADLNKERVKELPATDYGRVQFMAESGLAGDRNSVILRFGTVWGMVKYMRWDTWGNHLLSAKNSGSTIDIYHPNAMICMLQMKNALRAVEWSIGADPGIYNVADTVACRVDVAKKILGDYEFTVRQSDTPDISIGMDISRIIKAGFEFLEE